MGYEFDIDSLATIKVIGVGGGGSNAVNRMCELGIQGVEFIAANTDFQALNNCLAPTHLLLGESITHGNGAGGNPLVGEQCANDSQTDIKNALRNADMLFIAAGMGGGTGTGAAPMIAQIAKQMGILTVGIVTRPFTFEGKIRNANAVEGLEKLRPYCDSLIVISNDQLLQQFGNVSFKKAFEECNDILAHSVQIITDLIVQPAIINLDFNDVRSIMENKGTALIGIGSGKGENKARIAAENAIQSPLLELSIKGAKNAIVFINGGESMTPLDFHQAVQIIKEASQNPDINLIFGVRNDDNLEDGMEVTVIATDFETNDIALVEKDDEVIDSISSINIEDIGNETIEDDIDEELEEVEEETIVNIKEHKGFLPNFLKRRKR